MSTNPTPAPAPTPPPGTPPPPTTAASSQPPASDSQALILKVVGAIGTGIGVLGFVALFGGAILWIRAREANLPANDAVAAIPNSVLVTTGASFLVPAVLLALAAVSAIYLLHLAFYVPRRIKERGSFKEARDLSREAEKLGREAAAQTQLAQSTRALALTLGEAAEQAKLSPTVPDDKKRQLADDAEAHRKKAEGEEAKALALTSQAGEAKAKADNLQSSSEYALERPTWQFIAELIIGGLVLLLLPPLANQAIFHLGCWDVLVLVLVAVMATAVSLAAYVATDKFVWFGVVAFVTVGIYIGFATYYSTAKNPKVEPAAALRIDRPPVIGVYVADTASNLYLGSFPETGKPTRLMVIPRAQVTDLAIGPLLDRDNAVTRAVSLALDHCQLTIPIPKTDTTPASTKEACTDEEEKALRAQLG